MKNTIWALIILSSINVLAAEKARLIGDDENSGYEKLSCKQMIESNLKYQAVSGLNENAIAAELVKCRNFFWKSDREQCVKDVETLERKHRDMMNAFVNALGIRVQIYDSLNIADKSKLTPECRNVTARSYQRDINVSDRDFFKKLYLNCKIKTEVEMDSRIRISALYGNNREAYTEREVCKAYMYEYSKKLYGEPIRSMPPENKIKEAEVARQTQQACQKLSCETLLKNPVNNPSPCYRNQLLDCMVNNSTSGAGSTGNSPAGGVGR